MVIESVLSINTRGLKCRTKRLRLFHQVKLKAKLICFQETHSTSSDEYSWGKELGGRVYFSHGSSTARGVAIYLSDKLEWQVVKQIPDNDGRALTLILQNNNCKVCVTNVYAPNTSSALCDIESNVNYFEQIHQTLAEIKTTEGIENFVILGDFNFIRSKNLDAIGGSPTIYRRCVEQLEKLLKDFELVDLSREKNPDDVLVTFAPGGPNVRGIFRRLDYILIPEYWCDLTNLSRITPAIGTDHKLVYATFREPLNQKGPSMWHHNNTLNDNPEYKEDFEKNFNEWVSEADEILDPRCKWDFIKFKCKGHSQQFSKQIALSKRRDKENLEKELELHNKLCQSNPSDERIIAKTEKIKTELEKCLDEEIEKMAFISHTKHYEVGEKSSAFFFRQIKRNAQKSNISFLNLGKTTVETNTEINEAIYKFYKKLYTRDREVSEYLSSCEEKEDDFLSLETPLITKEQKDFCEKEVSAEEVRDILFNKLKSGKAGGNDGLSVGFYQTFWKFLEPFYLDCLNHSIKEGKLSASQTQSVIKLIEKPGKDKSKIENWRPISLCNNDNKIFSKLLANRIKKVLPTIISKQQLAFVKDRFIGEGVQLINGIIDEINSNNEQGLIIGVDFRKAFDSLSTEYLYKVLEKFNFGENFIHMIKTLYKGSESAVMNNGFTTKYFPLERSVKQGCCLSPYLFVLAIELLSKKIQQSKAIKGVEVGGKEYRINLFADDVTLFMKDSEAAAEALRIIRRFKRTSGLEINMGKSEIMWINQDLRKQTKITLGLKLVQQLKVTGVWFGSDNEDITERNFYPLLTKLARRLNEWKQRNLSVYGRITVLKAVGISQLIYMSTMVPCPEWVIKQANTLMFKFLWKGPDKITRSLAIQDLKFGGLRAPDLASMVKALQAGWVVRFQKPGNHGWKDFMGKAISQQGGNDVLTGKFMPNTRHCSKENMFNAALLAWGEIANSPQTPEQIRATAVWNNMDVVTKEGRTLFDKECAAAGFTRVEHFVDERGKFKSFHAATEDGFPKGKFLTWAAVIKSIPEKWRRSLQPLQEWSKIISPPTGQTGSRWDPQSPPIPTQHTWPEGNIGQRAHLAPAPMGSDNVERRGNAMLFLEDKTYEVSKLRTKTLYKTLIDKSPTPRQPYNGRITEQYEMTENEWETYYSMQTGLTISSKHRAFHWRQAHGLLYGNKHLHRFGYKSNSECHLCLTPKQTFEHLMIQCPVVTALWDEMQMTFSGVLAGGEITEKAKMTAILDCEDSFQTKNFLLLCFKKFIYDCNINGTRPFICQFLEQLKRLEKVEKKIAESKDRLGLHYQKWEDILNSMSIGIPVEFLGY